MKKKNNLSLNKGSLAYVVVDIQDRLSLIEEHITSLEEMIVNLQEEIYYLEKNIPNV